MPRTLEEVAEFMNQVHIAAFCTVNKKNQPHVVPVFFIYDEGKVFIHTDRDSAKVRNIQSNANVALTVFRGEFGDEAVAIRGQARILDETALVQRGHQLVEKYQLELDDKGRDSFGILIFDSGIRTVIEVTVEHLNYW